MDYDVVEMLIAGAIASGVAAGVWRVVKAWLAALERHANQMWREHGEGDDVEIKTQRVTDKVQALNMSMHVIPRPLIEKTVRAVRATSEPPPPAGPKPPPN